MTTVRYNSLSRAWDVLNFSGVPYATFEQALVRSISRDVDEQGAEILQVQITGVHGLQYTPGYEPTGQDHFELTPFLRAARVIVRHRPIRLMPDGRVEQGAH